MAERRIEDLIIDAKVILGDICFALSYDDRVNLDEEMRLITKGRIYTATETLSTIMKQLLEE